MERWAIHELFLAEVRERAGNTATACVPLGEVLVTPGAAHIAAMRAMTCLALHEVADWGLVPREDAQQNARNLKDGTRVMSAWAIDPQKPSLGYGDNTLWIITQWPFPRGTEAPTTTLLLPDEY